MTELAVMTARKIRLQQRSENGERGANLALELANKPDRFLSTVQIGITLVGTLSSAVAGARISVGLGAFLRSSFPVLDVYADTIALALIVLLITYLSLVLGELVPKRLALNSAENIAVLMARPMRFLERLAGPVVYLLSKSTDFVVRVLGIRKPDGPPVTEEEVRSMLQQGEQVGVFEETETDIVESVFRLGDRRVDSLMTPRVEIDWLDVEVSFEENLQRVIESPHVFLPLANGSLDEVMGIVSSKLLLTKIAQSHNTMGNIVNLTDFAQPALFIPESTPAFKVVEILRSASGNLALVIDEWGGVQGMVTLFDILEAIVGGVSEAGQPFEPKAMVREDGSWLIDGDMNIGEFKDLLDLPDMPAEDRVGFQTVAGFVLAQLGEIPTSGRFFEWNELTFEVVDMDGLRVDKVLVSKKASV
jgi:putative hemolysin